MQDERQTQDRLYVSDIGWYVGTVIEHIETGQRWRVVEIRRKESGELVNYLVKMCGLKPIVDAIWPKYINEYRRVER